MGKKKNSGSKKGNNGGQVITKAAIKNDKQLSKKMLNVYEVEEHSKATHQRLHNLDEVEKSNKYEVDVINSEDDEEIDSDDAYAEVEEITASTSTKKNKRKQKAASESEEDFDDMEEGFVDLSEMLKDEKPAPIKKKEPKASSKFTVQDLLTLEGDDSDLDQEREQFSASEEDEDTNLAEFVSKLDKTKKVQKYLTEKNETYKESEFNVTSTEFGSSSKLSLADLMAPLQDEAGFAHLTKKVHQFSGDKKKLDPLKAPLAKRLQDRINRAVAYEDAVERVAEWKPIIDQNRQADHLNFAKNIEDTTTCASLINDSKPVTSLEKELESVLAESRIVEKNIKEAEELELINVSPEEVKARQNELMKMRELMFRNEAKAKRISKIKSKAYRRLKKKEKLKDLELQKEFCSDSDEDRYDAEAARARERMTLKHKNTGKWAKSLLKHGSRHQENQTALMEQINEHERLKSKITGDASDRESDSDYDDETHDPQTHAISEIEKLISNPAEATTKGLMGMKFMQNALHNQKQELERLAAEAREDLEIMDSIEVSIEPKITTKIQGNEGRLAFAGNLPEEESQFDVRSIKSTADEPHIKNPSSGYTTKLSGPVTVPTNKPVTKNSNLTAPVNSTENPWLQQEDAPTVKRKRNNANDLTNSDKALKAVSKIKKTQQNNDSKNVSQPEVDVNAILPKEADSDDENSDNELQVDVPQMVPIDNPNAFSQKDLVRLAFAGDDVTKEFDEEKAQAIDADAPKVQDLSLPGWGSWGGLDVKTKPLSNAVKAKRNLLRMTKGVSAEKRKDRGLNHVIINEKRNKKLEKYTSKHVPSGYQSRAQYELSLATPLGQEWSPATTHYKATKPRILTKKGQIIDPLSMKDH